PNHVGGAKPRLLGQEVTHNCPSLAGDHRASRSAESCRRRQHPPHPGLAPRGASRSLKWWGVSYFPQAWRGLACVCTATNRINEENHGSIQESAEAPYRTQGCL